MALLYEPVTSYKLMLSLKVNSADLAVTTQRQVCGTNFSHFSPSWLQTRYYPRHCCPFSSIWEEKIDLTCLEVLCIALLVGASTVFS
jgi:hypothetical protein